MISIIIPCFNVGGYLDRCYASCLAQTYQDFEIIFVDDASTDGTLEQLIKIESLDKRVKVIGLSENVGTFHARKIGYKSSLGEYIFFLDPDDEIANNFLEVMLFQSREEDADIVFCGFDVKPERFYRRKMSIPREGQGVDVFKNCVLDLKNIPKGNGGKFYKRSLIEKVYKKLHFVVNRFVYAEDVVFFFAALLSAKKIASVKSEIYIYHLNSSSITKIRNEERIKYNINQVIFAIDGIKKISNDVGFWEKKASEKLIDSLMYDVNLLKRSISVANNDSYGYLLWSIRAIGVNPSWRDFFKIFVFFISFSRIKLF